MPYYYVNRNPQADGYHETHIDNDTCPHPPLPQNRHALGSHPDCKSAVAAAKAVYAKADGCAYCVPECNTR